MSPRFKTVLPAVVLLVVGMAAMAYLKYSETRQTGSDSPSQNPETQAQVPDAAVPSERESDANAVREPSRKPIVKGPGTVSDSNSRSDAEVGSDPEIVPAEREVVAQPDITPQPNTKRRADTSVADSGIRRPARMPAEGPAAGSSGPRSQPVVAGQIAVGFPQPRADDAVEPSQQAVADVSPVGQGVGPGFGNLESSKPEPEAEPETIPFVRMVPSSTEVVAGGPVSITVEISSATDVGHVPFHLTYDSRVLEFESGDEGSYLGSDGVQTAFFATASRNAVVVGLSRLGRIEGVSGGGDLCVLHFTAVGPGNAALGFSRAKVRDSSNQIVPSVFEPAVVVVH